MSQEIDVDVLSEKEARYDEMFLSVLQNEGKIEPFLDCVFKFLYRRTDFYLIQENPKQAYGFPAGISKQIVLKTFQKYDNFSKEKLKSKLLETNKELAKKTIETKKTLTTEETNNKSQIEAIKQESSSAESEQDKLKRMQEIFQKNPSSYNGAIRENYSWSQSIKDIDVRVKLNQNIKSSKDVKIKIEKESLQVSVKNDSNWLMLINDKLAWKIKPDESTWSLFPGDHIHIYLEKTMERWWEHLLVSEEKLDLKNMNPEKPMEDLDEESQAKIKQMMYDEQQKKLGKPTSEQQKTNEILRKAWDMEGSPFKGQTFDPSLVTTSGMNQNI